MIYVFNTSGKPELIADSVLNNSISRFGWSDTQDCDLLHMEEMKWEEMNDNQITIWKKTNFLLNVTQGDWVIHVNTPSHGKCIAAEVSSAYYWDPEGVDGDYRHCIKIKPETTIQFNRNDHAVHPAISRRLKLQGHYWRIYMQDEFFNSLKNLKEGIKKIDTESKGVYHLKSAIEKKEIYEQFTELIQSTHPEKKLEYLLRDVFKKVPNVLDAKVNGSGWGTDYGADVIVKYSSGLNILNLQSEETLVVQVKSFVGEHTNLTCVKQLETAIEKYHANSAMLITTATASEELEISLNKLAEKLKVPIELMSSGDVAKFILKYYSDEIIKL